MSGQDTTAETPNVFVLGQGDLSNEELDTLLTGAGVALAESATVRVAGPGAVQCMQGLFTNDLEAAGDSSFLYGALLTNKGMIVTDMWIARDGDDLSIIATRSGAPALLHVLHRSLPPRLAHYRDESGNWHLLQLVGPRALELVGNAHLPIPEPGRLQVDHGCVIMRPLGPGPFALQVACVASAVGKVRRQLVEAGVGEAGSGTLELARILAGWPRLGAEIDSKTLPQEVRFDELGGLSHSKGCYLGQETVARLHFRGHTNRRLMGLRWEAPPDPSEPTVTRGDRTVGRVTSSAWAGAQLGHLGLAMIRREVEADDSVIAGGARARTVDLPHRESA